MLKRQLVGFYLLNGLKDSHLRLPVEAINRLASILYTRKFTKDDDSAILAWVDQHGPKKWTALAKSLDRYYIHGRSSVMNRFFFSEYQTKLNFHQHLTRYKVLIEKKESRSKFVRYADTDKDVELLKEVLKQDSQALRKMSPAGIAWGEVADRLSRPKNELYRDWINRILPTLRRHLAGKTS